MVKVDFNEERHEYSVGGKKIPSVSEILAPLSADRYKDINPAVLQAAAARGTAVHEACEAIDYGIDAEIDPAIAGYVAAYQQFLHDYFPRWNMVEQIVGYRIPFEADEERILFCGTVDRYGIIDGKGAVLDIKTYASVTTDAMMSASCQTILYASALESEGFNSPKRYLLHLKKDGDYRLIDLQNFDKERGFHSLSIAWKLYEIWDDCNAARKTNKKGKKNNE